MILLTILLILSGIHLLIGFILVTGILRAYPRRKDTPSISIVIPVRNEEDVLARLLDSLLRLDYPPEQYEIILVNDESEDRTREIALEYSSRFKCDYKVIDADHSKEPVLTAKTLPLAQGLDIARGEYVLMTDGDCELPPSWARAMVSYFTEDIGVVCGITLPDLRKPPRFPRTWIEAVDWSFLLGVCSGFAGRGKPLALIGNNYAVNMTAYRELGTFRKMEYNSIDDMALQRAMQKSGKWKIAFPADHETLVRTMPMGSVLLQARQRRRWSKGMAIMDLPGKLVLAFTASTNMTWPFWPIVLGPLGWIPVALLAISEYVVIAATLNRVRVHKPLSLALLYPAYIFSYSWMWIYYLLRSRTVEWKSRPFTGRPQ